MLSELVQLNKVYKTNQFTTLFPKLYADQIVFSNESGVETRGLKNGGIGKQSACKMVSKLNKVTEFDVGLEQLLISFGIDPEVTAKVEEWYLKRMETNSDFNLL